MQYNILQFSDIHLGSNYNNHLDTQGQWDAVLKHAKKTCPNSSGLYDAVVLTGDLVDDTNMVDKDNNCSAQDVNYTDEAKLRMYIQILTDVKQLVRNDGLVMVTPGNHDNRALLGKAAVKVGIKGATEDMFMVPGECIQYGKVGGYTIVTMDTGNGEPYKAIAALAYNVNRSSWDKSRALMFTHKPFKAYNLYHRFMKDNMLDAPVGQYMVQYVDKYFCGHLHHYSSINFNGPFDLTVCPGVQCQIDPYSEKCNAIALPGYLQITIDTAEGVYHRAFMLDNWQEILIEQ